MSFLTKRRWMARHPIVLHFKPLEIETREWLDDCESWENCFYSSAIKKLL